MRMRRLPVAACVVAAIIVGLFQVGRLPFGGGPVPYDLAVLSGTVVVSPLAHGSMKFHDGAERPIARSP